jgi:hypothetical protein
MRSPLNHWSARDGTAVLVPTLRDGAFSLGNEMKGRRYLAGGAVAERELQRDSGRAGLTSGSISAFAPPG